MTNKLTFTRFKNLHLAFANDLSYEIPDHSYHRRIDLHLTVINAFPIWSMQSIIRMELELTE